MKPKIVFFLLVLLRLAPAQSQEGMPAPLNLIKNGDFELGDSRFESDYQYSPDQVEPGQYTVTRHASWVSKDYKDPVHGDHTSGRGFYMIVDSDDKAGKKAWFTRVSVIPNSNYRFTVYFCNLFKHKGNDSGFQLNGMPAGGYRKQNDCKIQFYVRDKPIGETEKDIFHAFNWVRATVIWYSGTLSGEVEISIRNLNYSASGNDLALDDIEFAYIETMPPGYKPPQKTTILVEEIRRPEIDTLFQRQELRKMIHEKAMNRTQGDSVAPGIYTIYKASREEYRQPYDKIAFTQGLSSLTPDAIKKLDRLADWIKIETSPSTHIRLEGHTDNQGDPTLNVKLSKERADKIKEYLVAKGIAPARIETVGFGGEHPVADNTNEETRKENRRVEIVILWKK